VSGASALSKARLAQMNVPQVYSGLLNRRMPLIGEHNRDSLCATYLSFPANNQCHDLREHSNGLAQMLPMWTQMWDEEILSSMVTQQKASSHQDKRFVRTLCLDLFLEHYVLR
jgi:hypothetical protein